MQLQTIQNKIYEVRGHKVMLDFDLAELYDVPTKSLNLSVKRNIKRFPKDFMFQLTKDEWDTLRFQFETSNGRGGMRYLPHAFTEQGVAMLSGVLNSDRAISMHIAIMRAFIEIKQILIRENDVKEQLKQIKKRISEHDTQLNHIYQALENLLTEKEEQQTWKKRKQIGFKK